MYLMIIIKVARAFQDIMMMGIKIKIVVNATQIAQNVMDIILTTAITAITVNFDKLKIIAASVKQDISIHIFNLIIQYVSNAISVAMNAMIIALSTAHLARKI